ncbi:hypothetical protein QJQ45_004235 [Haematococcus lacustris]|nr:hypothetical protein QJQ45_004235 [Haematococcus lacustris]
MLPALRPTLRNLAIALGELDALSSRLSCRPLDLPACQAKLQSSARTTQATAQQLRDICEQLAAAQTQLFIKAFAKALEVIPRQLCNNAGHDATDVLNMLRQKHAAPDGAGKAPHSSQEAPQSAASEPGPSTPLPAKRTKRTKAEPDAAMPTKGKGKAAKAKPAPQPGRWLDRDCNAALNMQCIGESRWRPLELCWWPDQGALPAKGKEYPGLGYKRVRDKPPRDKTEPAVTQ